MANCPRTERETEKIKLTLDDSPGIQRARSTLAQFQGHCPSGTGSPRNSGRLTGSEGDATWGNLKRVVPAALLGNSSGDKSEERQNSEMHFLLTEKTGGSIKM